MNKTCARCEKTVYPIEELKCLDKIWHKGCFKCQECGMTLNMKTYKGFGKLPYCESHVPKAKHTTMAETPELKRIAENTKLQSNVVYHASFEKSKGKFTQVADDPETLRIKANTQIISNVAYHDQLAKKAAMEKQRTLNENGVIEPLPTPDTYDVQIESYDMRPPSAAPPPAPTPTYQPPKQTQYAAQTSPSDYTNSNQPYRTPDTQPPQKYDHYNQSQPNQLKYEQNQPKYDHSQQKYDRQHIYDHHAQSKYDSQPEYDNTQTKYDHSQPKYDHNQPKYDPNQAKYDHSQLKYDQNQPKYDHNQPKYDHSQPKYEHNQPKYDHNKPRYDHSQPKYDQHAQQSYPQHAPNPQADYAYQYQQPNVPISAYPTPAYDEYARNSREAYGVHAQGYHGQHGQHAANYQPRPGKIEDYDPVTDGPRQQTFTPRPNATLIYSSDRNNGRASSQQSAPASRRPVGNVQDLEPLAGEQRAPEYRAPPPQQHQLTHTMPAAAKVYIAMYDYDATDADEVSFQEGDLISNVTSIDAGWMTGQVLRTGRTGMLPANYVELAPM